MSGLGEGYFRKGELDKSIKTYEKALEEILANYGENDYYRVTVRNLELVRDTKKRAEAVRNQKLKGMDIARRYYEEYGKPMLEENFQSMWTGWQQDLWAKDQSAWDMMM